jgi:uncharacterized protein (UPF0261 family)
LDTKGVEYGWLRDRLAAAGVDVVLVDTGILGPPRTAPDITREEVARAAGADLTALRAQGDRGVAVAAMARGAAAVAHRLYGEGRLHAIVSVGGSGNSTISTAAMRALPLGVPKLMVSSMTSGDVSPYIGTTDITMMYSVVDIAGINRICAPILANAAAAIAGMARDFAARHPPDTPVRPLIGATMLGVTTPGVDAARERLTELGYEVLVFHATGSGDRSMEAMATQGLLAGVLDVTLVELANELVTGSSAAGPHRLEAATQAGLPQVISPGALDMVKFGPHVPARFQHRQIHVHNSSVTVIRTTPEECAALGRLLARKLRTATSPVSVFLPLRGLSTLSTPGGPYHEPTADKALFTALRDTLTDTPVQLHELDTHINDPAFGQAMANHLHALLTEHDAAHPAKTAHH